MDEDLTHRYSRWRAAESAGADEEADAAFKAVFAALPDRPAPLDFAASTMRAVADAAARDTRRTRRTRRLAVAGGVVGGGVAAYYGAGWLASALSTAFVGFLNLVIGAVVGAATVMERGGSVWTIVGNLGRAMAAFVSDPKVTFMMIAVQGIAAAALFALQRLLGSDRETFR